MINIVNATYVIFGIIIIYLIDLTGEVLLLRKQPKYWISMTVMLITASLALYVFNMNAQMYMALGCAFVCYKIFVFMTYKSLPAMSDIIKTLALSCMLWGYLIGFEVFERFFRSELDKFLEEFKDKT